MASRPSGTVVVLRSGANQKRARGGRSRQLCRVWSDFMCECGRVFVGSVVAEFSLIRWPASGRVGPVVTPHEKQPRWHLPSCKAEARRSPLLHRVCARPGCDHAFTSRTPNQRYHVNECRTKAAVERRRKRRPRGEPLFEFTLHPDTITAVVGGRAAEARRVAMEREQDAEARAYEERLKVDPDFRPCEGRRQAEARRAANDLEAMRASALRVAADLAEKAARLGELQQAAKHLQAEALVVHHARVDAARDWEAMLTGAVRVVGEHRDREAMGASARQFAPEVDREAGRLAGGNIDLGGGRPVLATPKEAHNP